MMLLYEFQTQSKWFPKYQEIDCVDSMKILGAIFDEEGQSQKRE